MNIASVKNFNNYPTYNQKKFNKPTFTGINENKILKTIKNNNTDKFLNPLNKRNKQSLDYIVDNFSDTAEFFINKLGLKCTTPQHTNEMFLNKDLVFTPEIMSIPRRLFSGFIEKSVYHSNASKDEPLNQENIWMLFSPICFFDFLKQDSDLFSILDNNTASRYFNLDNEEIDLSLFCDFQKECAKNHTTNPFADFITELCNKYNIDILEQPKLYRFIGKSELIKLLKGETIECRRAWQNGIDVTTNPELSFGYSQYRITFKTNETFDPRGELHSPNTMIVPHNANDYYFYLTRPYSISDIEKIEMGTPHGLLELNLNRDFTEEEIQAIDPLMFYAR